MMAIQVQEWARKVKKMHIDNVEYTDLSLTLLRGSRILQRRIGVQAESSPDPDNTRQDGIELSHVFDYLSGSKRMTKAT